MWLPQTPWGWFNSSGRGILSTEGLILRMPWPLDLYQPRGACGDCKQFTIRIITIQSLYGTGIPIYVMGFHWQCIWEFHRPHCRIRPSINICIHGAQGNRISTIYIHILTVHRIKGRLARRRETWMSTLWAYIWPHRAPPLITQSNKSSISLFPSFRL